MAVFQAGNQVWFPDHEQTQSFCESPLSAPKATQSPGLGCSVGCSELAVRAEQGCGLYWQRQLMPGHLRNSVTAACLAWQRSNTNHMLQT